MVSEIFWINTNLKDGGFLSEIIQLYYPIKILK